MILNTGYSLFVAVQFDCYHLKWLFKRGKYMVSVYLDGSYLHLSGVDCPEIIISKNKSLIAYCCNIFIDTLFKFVEYESGLSIYTDDDYYMCLDDAKIIGKSAYDHDMVRIQIDRYTNAIDDFKPIERHLWWQYAIKIDF